MDRLVLFKFHDPLRGYWWIRRVCWKSGFGSHFVDLRGVKVDSDDRVVELDLNLRDEGEVLAWYSTLFRVTRLIGSWGPVTSVMP